MAKVTGIGGIFFKTQDPDSTRDWYRPHLGIETDEYGAWGFKWRDREDPQSEGYTVWAPN